jgi:hypothetical protein
MPLHGAKLWLLCQLMNRNMASEDGPKQLIVKNIVNILLRFTPEPLKNSGMLHETKFIIP